MRFNPYERQSLEILLGALQSGLSPSTAYSSLTDLIQARDARVSAQRERRSAHTDALEALLEQRAGEGATLEEAIGEARMLAEARGLGPRVREDLWHSAHALYPAAQATRTPEGWISPLAPEPSAAVLDEEDLDAIGQYLLTSSIDPSTGMPMPVDPDALEAGIRTQFTLLGYSPEQIEAAVAAAKARLGTLRGSATVHGAQNPFGSIDPSVLARRPDAGPVPQPSPAAAPSPSLDVLARYPSAYRGYGMASEPEPPEEWWRRYVR